MFLNEDAFNLSDGEEEETLGTDGYPVAASQENYELANYETAEAERRKQVSHVVPPPKLPL